MAHPNVELHYVLLVFLAYVMTAFLAYVMTAFLARPNWAQVLQDTVMPHLGFSSNNVAGALALLAW